MRYLKQFEKFKINENLEDINWLPNEKSSLEKIGSNLAKRTIEKGTAKIIQPTFATSVLKRDNRQIEVIVNKSPDGYSAFCDETGDEILTTNWEEFLKKLHDLMIKLFEIDKPNY